MVFYHLISVPGVCVHPPVVLVLVHISSGPSVRGFGPARRRREQGEVQEGRQAAGRQGLDTPRKVGP